MPISVILLGVFIILINFKIGESVYKRFDVSLLILDLVSILAFILLIVKPINYFDVLYVSLGGFFIFTLFAIYSIFTVKKRQDIYLIGVSVLSLFGSIFLFNLIFPFMHEQLFNISTVAVGVFLGIIAYIITKNIKLIFISIFLTIPLAGIVNYFINIRANPEMMLFLGVGNLFEIAVIAFAVAYTLKALSLTVMFKTHSTDKKDLLTPTNNEVKELKNKKEV